MEQQQSNPTEPRAWFANVDENSPLYVPDLRLWYKWHRQRGTLPADWQGRTLTEVARELGVPAWTTARPWQTELPGIEVETREAEGVRWTTYHTPAGDLSERWALGPDGDWWQMEYPVKSDADLAAARALVEARNYRAAPEMLKQAATDWGDGGVLALELPMRPYSDMLHTLLGWGEGLMLLRGEGRPVLLEMLAMLDAKLQALVGQLASVPTVTQAPPTRLAGGQLVLAPDNLDGQYISPRTFREHLASSYRQTAQILHAADRRLIVHAGGQVGRLLPLLAEAGVDAVTGVAGPGDLSLSEARASAGPGLVLWGGIPQDLLLATYDPAMFAAGVAEAARLAALDERMILGIADHVPVDAEPGRLSALASLIAGKARVI